MDDVRLKAVDQIAPMLAEPEERMRTVLLERLVLPNLAYLRRGNSMRVGQDGWYAAQERVELAGAAADFNHFPIPSECAAWHDLEFDKRDGLAFRFFARHAWLYLAPPRRACRLEFIVPFTLIDEVLGRLAASLGDVPIAPLRGEPDGLGRSRMMADISPQLLAYMQIAKRVRLDLECSVTGVPALLHKGSTDRRRLSCAISFPRFVEA